MVTEEQVLNSLSGVMDPEINLNIVELGFIYKVDIDGADVNVDMTLTTKGCPMHQFLWQKAVQAVQSIEGVGEVEVNLVWKPPWSPKMMSDEAKKKLGFSDDMLEG